MMYSRVRLLAGFIAWPAKAGCLEAACSQWQNFLINHLLLGNTINDQILEAEPDNMAAVWRSENYRGTSYQESAEQSAELVAACSNRSKTISEDLNTLARY